MAFQVSAGSADRSEHAEEQASSLEETAASMEQLGAMVRAPARDRPATAPQSAPADTPRHAEHAHDDEWQEF